MTRSSERPVVALVMGDPAAIGPELTVKLLGRDDLRKVVRIVVVDDRRVLEDGAAVAGLVLDIDEEENAAAPTAPSHSALLGGGRPDPAAIRRGIAAREGGGFALANYRLSLATAGHVDAVCYTPFNKAAKKLAEPPYGEGALHTAAVLGHAGPLSEFNVLGRL